MYIRWLIFSCDLLSLYPAVHFPRMWLSGIIEIIDSNDNCASLWNVSQMLYFDRRRSSWRANKEIKNLYCSLYKWMSSIIIACNDIQGWNWTFFIQLYYFYFYLFYIFKYEFLIVHHFFWDLLQSLHWTYVLLYFLGQKMKLLLQLINVIKTIQMRMLV